MSNKQNRECFIASMPMWTACCESVSLPSNWPWQYDKSQTVALDNPHNVKYMQSHNAYYTYGITQHTTISITFPRLSMDRKSWIWFDHTHEHRHTHSECKSYCRCSYPGSASLRLFVFSPCVYDVKRYWQRGAQTSVPC